MSVRYALVYFFDPSKTGPTEREYQEWVEFENSAKEAGQLVHGAGLYPSSEAKSVSIRDGQVAVEDGVPAGEAVAGYYLLEVPRRGHRHLLGTAGSGRSLRPRRSTPDHRDGVAKD
jgi:hypothetical protein